MVCSELAYLTAAPDAEAQIERQFHRSPGIETGPMLKQESYQTSYAYLLMARGERSRAATLLAEALTRAHKALESGNENQRVPSRSRRFMPREARTIRRSTGSKRRSPRATRTTPRSAGTGSSQLSGRIRGFKTC